MEFIVKEWNKDPRPDFGAEIQFDCTATGVPEPKCSWEKKVSTILICIRNT